MRTETRFIRIIVLATLAAAFLAVAANAANDLKFHAAPGPEPVIGRYLVTLDSSVTVDLAASSAEALAQAYGGQLEPYKSSDVRQFAIAMLPARARGLSADARVRQVVEIAQHEDGTMAPPPSTPPANSSRHMVPIASDSSSSGTYLYDGSGNIKTIGNDTFFYDTVGRLKQAVVQGSQESYDYDPFGNRKSSVRVAGAAGCVGGCDLPVNPDQHTNHVAEASYDEGGSVLSINGAAYSYDGTGMVTGMTVGTSDHRDFLYTADDERIAVRQAASWTWTVRDQSAKVLREFTSLETSASPLTLSQHTWSKDYVWRDGLLLASVNATASGTTTYHYHLDHLGTPRLVTDQNHVLIGKHTYYPFGAEMDLMPRENPVELMKFTGHERDVVAGENHNVDYMHARYYGPGGGRFLSPDPVLGNIRAPQSWNRYAYVRNNPLTLIDPTGRYECTGTDKQCTAFESARQDNLTSSRASNAVKSASSAYGNPNDGNGIVVTFGATRRGKGAEAKLTLQTTVNEKGIASTRAQGTVTINPDLLTGHGNVFHAAVAHEGSHVLDAQALAASYRNDGSHDTALDVTGRQTEINAYRVTADIANLTNATFKFDGGVFSPMMIPASLNTVIEGILKTTYDPDYLKNPAFVYPVK